MHCIDSRYCILLKTKLEMYPLHFFEIITFSKIFDFRYFLWFFKFSCKAASSIMIYPTIVFTLGKQTFSVRGFLVTHARKPHKFMCVNVQNCYWFRTSSNFHAIAFKLQHPTIYVTTNRLPWGPWVNEKNLTYKSRCVAIEKKE